MFPDNNEITLYALKLSKDGHPRKIHAIKVLRSIAALSGAELLLRPGKALIDNIDNAPIVVTFTDNERGIVTMLVNEFFVTVKPETRETYLSSAFTWPEPEPMPSYDFEPHC